MKANFQGDLMVRITTNWAKISAGFLMCATLVIFAVETSLAVPADPTPHLLAQPDGTTFYARQWGDEMSSGFETEDQHSIEFDKVSKKWFYSIQLICL